MKTDDGLVGYSLGVTQKV